MRWSIGRNMIVPILMAFLAAAAATTGVDATQLLQNPGFEENAQGGQPPPPPWVRGYHPATAGAVTTATAAHTGSFGLWAYTYDGPERSFSSAYQTIAAAAGATFRGRTFARTAPVGGEGSWVTGSFALLRLSFLDASEAQLASYDSDPVTSASAPWDTIAVVTDPAPEGTAWVRFTLYLEKPAVDGQSIANFDDCLLEETLTPVLYISDPALGFGFYHETRTFTIENPGTGTLTWHLDPAADWISVSQNTGETTAETDTIVAIVDRTGLPPDSLSFHSQIHVTSNGGNASLEIYMEQQLSHPVPDAPAEVTTDGYRLLLRPRLPDGSLAEFPRPYGIMGTCWSPASVGTQDDRFARQAEFEKWYELDIQMLREMKGNTVYVFLDFGTEETSSQILDYLYYNGVMAIVTVDWDGTYDLDRLELVINAYKDHPAILMWAIGNEWNINLYHEMFFDIWEAAAATEVAAQHVKALDTNHPVASIYGEIEILPDQPLSTTEMIINDICPTVDVWGLNIYRGPSFGTLFQQWESIVAKPMFLSEYGADSFFSTSWWPVEGYVDETMQADFNHGLWEEIAANLSCCYQGTVCAGGTVFEWCDEWWKTGSPFSHDPDGYETWWNPDAFPDGFGNEEYFGIVKIDRTIKESYERFQGDFAVAGTLPCAVDDGGRRSSGRYGFSFSLTARGQGAVIARGDGADLSLDLPSAASVCVEIVDPQGRRIRTLLETWLPEGSHLIHWDGRNVRGDPIGTGVYLCRATVNGSSRTLKLVLVE